jgi:hypothetical protein
VSGDDTKTAIALVDKAPAPGDAIRALIEPHRAQLVSKAVELALLGDPRSLDLVFKYLAPPAKPDAERIAVPGLREAPTIRDKSLAIIEAVSNGLISVEAGEKVQRMLELHTKAVTIGELAEQIEALKSGRATPLLLAQRTDDDYSDLA